MWWRLRSWPSSDRLSGLELGSSPVGCTSEERWPFHLAPLVPHKEPRAAPTRCLVCGPGTAPVPACEPQALARRCRHSLDRAQIAAKRALCVHSGSLPRAAARVGRGWAGGTRRSSARRSSACASTSCASSCSLWYVSISYFHRFHLRLDSWLSRRGEGVGVSPASIESSVSCFC